MPAARLTQPRRSADTTRVVSTSPAGTEIELAGAGAARLRVAAWPDAEHAARVLRMLDRVVWQRLEVGDGTASGIVAGTRRHRPVRLQVSGSAALGLLEAGVPTVARSVGATP